MAQKEDDGDTKSQPITHCTDGPVSLKIDTDPYTAFSTEIPTPPPKSLEEGGGSTGTPLQGPTKL